MTDPVDHPAEAPNPPEDGANDKAEIREQMRAALAALDEDERRHASKLACSRLIGLDAFRQASVVMLYMPLITEVDTTPISIACFQTNKTICVPRVYWERKDMRAVEVRSFDDHFMETDEHGLRTPRTGQLLPEGSIDLVVVPGLAFDPQGNRLGRGGGFYDRFLTRMRRGAVTVGLAFDQQITDQVPVNERDVRVDIVVTDRRLTETRRSSRSGR